MSGSVSSDGRQAQQLLFTHILSFIPYTIVFYDYCLTLSDEVELFWLHPAKFNLFSYLFLLNRYVSLFGNLEILIFGIIGRIEFMSCSAAHMYHMVLLLIQQTFVAFLCLMQIHAVYQSRRVLSFLILLAIAGFGIPCWSMYALSGHHLTYPVVITPVLGCSRLVGETEGFYSAISWTGCLVIDTAVFILLLYKTIRVGRGVRILDTIMRNATIYYSILCLVNLSNILILRFASPALRTSTIALTNALSCTLISRAILDLRSKFGSTARTPNTVHAYRPADEQTEHGSGVPSFLRSFFGNSVSSSIGES
jgi:hypothetical protein